MQTKFWDTVADKYFESIMSPFEASVQNPIYYYLNKLDGRDKTVIDIGCGIGNLIPHLAERFSKVTAIDISPKMVEQSIERNKFNNVSFHVMDTLNLEKLGMKFDVAVSINSIIDPSIKNANLMMKQVNDILEPEGRFLAIFPAMEAIIYHTMLLLDKYLKEGMDETQAKIKAAKVHKKRFDFIFGLDEEGLSQKYYYKFELPYRLKEAGFKSIVIRKVFYPWKVCEESDFESFPGKKPMWDWFVSARK